MQSSRLARRQRFHREGAARQQLTPESRNKAQKSSPKPGGIPAGLFLRVLQGHDPGMTAPLLFEQARTLHQQGKLVEAERLYRQAMAAAPDNLPIRHMLALVLYQQLRAPEALAAAEAALKLNPQAPDTLSLRAALLQGAGRHREALEGFDAALALKPDAAGWYNRGAVLKSLGRLDEALASHERAAALSPRHAGAWYQRGLILVMLQRSEEALAALTQTLAIAPEQDEAWKIHGVLLQSLNRHDEALASYDRCLALNAGHGEVWSNRGHILRRMKRLPEALASYDRAVAANPGNAAALHARAMMAWIENRDYAAALADLEQAAALNPDCPYVLGALLLVKQYGGDWHGFDDAMARIDTGVRAGKPVTEPFVYQAISQSPADLMACSVIHAADRYPPQAPLAALAARGPHSGKIRIGYASGELREQATAYLMAGLYECHDKSKFEIVAFDHGFDDGSAVRKRLEAAFNKVVDISRLPDRHAAERIAAEKIDILVNLNGYFGDHRMGVFAHRPAPIQVNYLGFPATLGAPYMDYILADRIVIPQTERRFYTEQVVYLPDSYQANDSNRAIAEAVPPRAACGLPADGFVFCNFNAGYKLTPQAFAAWMRILNQVPGSLLWLLDGGPHFAANLRREAQAQGVNGARLIFAPVVKLAAHLARLQQADLFLDCLPYNAHTTASDCLWAGVPLLTCKGMAFPGRVAASLLNAIGLPELVTQTMADYEKLAVTLASDPAQLAGLRQKLAANRLTTPLFDTARFTRHLEAAYEKMWATRGETPAGFSI